jgi:hypothetical protein
MITGREITIRELEVSLSQYHGDAGAVLQIQRGQPERLRGHFPMTSLWPNLEPINVPHNTGYDGDMMDRPSKLPVMTHGKTNNKSR